MSSRYAVVDLFAGPGGLSEGFSQVRDHKGDPVYDLALSVEKETSAHKTLTLRSMVHQLNDDQLRLYRSKINEGYRAEGWSDVFPEEWRHAQEIALKLELGTQNAQSVIDARIGEIKSQYDGNTVLIGGPPCQAYSLVGRARNLGNPNYRAEDDGRHYLYREYIRILDMLRPAVFVMENVKGILSSRVDGTYIFPIILEELQNLASEEGGYKLLTLATPKHRTLWEKPDPRDFIIRAEERGVPQARHRVIVVGVRQDIARRLPEGIRQSGLLPMWRDSATVSSVLSGIPPLRSRLSRGGDSLEKWQQVIRKSLCLLQSNSQIVRDEQLATEIERIVTVIDNNGGPVSQESNVMSVEDRVAGHLADWIQRPGLSVLPNHETRGHLEADLTRYIFAAAFAVAHGYSPKAMDFPDNLAPNHKNWKSGKFNDRFRVQRWDAPSSTVTSHISKDGHYYIHPDPLQARSLTVREAARLQTFPDDYLFLGNRTQQYVQVGNAVPAYLAFQIAIALAKTLGGEDLVG